MHERKQNKLSYFFLLNILATLFIKQSPVRRYAVSNVHFNLVKTNGSMLTRSIYVGVGFPVTCVYA